MNGPLENDWQSCVTNFETAIKAYKSYIKINSQCRRQCQEVSKQDLILEENSSEELLFYEKKVLITLCLLKCKFSQPDFVSADEFVHRDQLFPFETLEAYNYLQLCYYQVRYGFFYLCYFSKLDKTMLPLHQVIGSCGFY